MIFNMRTSSRVGKSQGGDSVVERTVLRTMLAVISTGKMVVIRGSTCLKSPKRGKRYGLSMRDSKLTMMNVGGDFVREDGCHQTFLII